MRENLYPDRLIRSFAESLSSSGVSDLTIKNYLCDIRQFLRWRKGSTSGDVESFTHYLSSKLSGSSLRRKASAIRKYLDFEKKYSNDSHGFLKYSFLPVLASLVMLLLLASAIGDEYALVTKDVPIAPVSYTINIRAPSSFDKSNLSIILPKEENDEIVLSSNVETQDFEIAQSLPPYEINEAGLAKIEAGKRQTVVLSNLISADSFVYLTPRSITDQVLYVDEVGDGFAVVAVQEEAHEDLHFQWKVDNTEVYSDIL